LVDDTAHPYDPVDLSTMIERSKQYRGHGIISKIG
jgi:hypothetical protein